MDFDIVIATRNRHEALRLSLPLMLNQSRLPSRLILVDASDDHETTKTIARDTLAATGSVEPIIIRSLPGLCYQRNIGLCQVCSPVVFFPDDDALWFPDYADAIMRIYERDSDGLVGAVGGTESVVPPDGMLPGSRAPTDGLNVTIPRSIEDFLNRLEKRFSPDPFFLEARHFYRGRMRPQWLAEVGAALAPTITGFRMSFRTEVIRRTGFDEALAKYGLFEDHDACMGVLATHSIVTASEARVFHYRPPEKRADDFEMGVMHVLNRAYIVAKHTRDDHAIDSALKRYSWYKLLRYLPRAYDRSMRDRMRGAWYAARGVSRLCHAPKSGLASEYLSLRADCLAHR